MEMQQTSVVRAQFRVNKTFVLTLRRLFVVSGRIVSGSVAPGMQLRVGDAGRSFLVDVHSVEFIDPPEAADHEVGLTIYMGARDWVHMLERSFPPDSLVPLYPAPQRFPCPCCGHLTLDSAPPGTFHICEVCFWEDDPIQFQDPEYTGGANVPSLREAAANFAAFGASERRFVKFVRKPRADELSPSS
jgi:hypothetical protein